MDKLNKKLLGSPNLQQERIEQLKHLMPDLFTDEGSLNTTALKELVGSDYLAKESYNFSWYGKADARQKAFSPSYATLIKDEKRSVHPQDGKGNMIIEGENLEVLKVLLHSYRETIKCIYIDPPYNTGSDFVYKDSWASNSQEYLEAVGATADGIKLATLSNSDGRKHSDWLSMIYARLLVARQLLKDDGVIFVSIDDNEQANLKKVMDEVFGEENFRNQIIVRRGAKSVQAQFDTWDKLGQDTEYILFYTKNSDYRFPKQMKKLDEVRMGTWNNHWRGTNRPTMRYTLFDITPQNGQWRWSKERSLNAIVNYNTMLVKLNKTPESITQEEIDNYYLETETSDLLRLSKTGKPEHYIPPTDSTLLNSSWYDLLIGSSTEIHDLFDSKVFDTAKLTSVIKRILNFCGKDDIILDFFAGSGTTAHAVMDLNAKDGGNRKFILVQLKEQIEEKNEAYKAGYKFISDITIARNQKAIEKNLYNTGFTVYSLAQSHFPRVEFELDNHASQEQNLDRLEAYIAEKENAIVLGSMVSNEHALLDEVLLKQGFKLDYTLEKQACTTNTIYKVDDGSQSAYVSVDKELKSESFSYLSTLQDSLFICLGMALTTSQRHELNQILGKNLIII